MDSLYYINGTNFINYINLLFLILVQIPSIYYKGSDPIGTFSGLSIFKSEVKGNKMDTEDIKDKAEGSNNTGKCFSTRDFLAFIIIIRRPNIKVWRIIIIIY